MSIIEDRAGGCGSEGLTGIYAVRGQGMKHSQKAPTMKDVSIAAQVSLGTVSKVINGIPVGEAYRRKVVEAIDRLGYQVNNYARGMRTNRTYSVAFLVPNIVSPFFAALANQLNRVLLKRNYRMLLCCTDYNGASEQGYIRMAQQHKVDGIIGLTYNPDLVIDGQTPFVSIDRMIHPGISVVASDNFAGGELSARKLSELGCKRVAFLRVGSSLRNEPNKRKAGFENECREIGLPFEMKILTDGESYEAFRAFLAERIAGGKLGIDGIFCVTDRLAYIIIGMLREMGLRVPEDVQVIGYDGARRFGNLAYECSTIVQPVNEMAEMCVDLLLDRWHSERPSLVCLPVTYAYGGTTREKIGEDHGEIGKLVDVS